MLKKPEQNVEIIPGVVSVHQVAAGIALFRGDGQN